MKDLNKKIEVLNQLLQYSPPMPILPNGCGEYQKNQEDFEKKSKYHSKHLMNDLNKKIEILNQLLQYSPPTPILPNGGIEYQKGRADFEQNK